MGERRFDLLPKLCRGTHVRFLFASSSVGNPAGVVNSADRIPGMRAARAPVRKASACWDWNWDWNRDTEIGSGTVFDWLSGTFLVGRKAPAVTQFPAT